eukprot:s571_g20.t5
MELAFAASRPVAQLSAGVNKGVSQPWQRAKTHRTQVNAELAGASVLASACALHAKAQSKRGGRRAAPVRQNPVRVQRRAAADLQDLVHLGGTAAEKALAVNLDSKFYGSFAEIGAGQEVSRTFLQAGAAAGTVARSISAYDMKMSDVNYGKASWGLEAKRYVTQERLKQMLDTEYDIVEKNLRSLKGEDACFFAFADTLAAKAFNSNRECEGWIGLTYQANPKEARSTVILHIRMSQPSAQLQGQAIGVLGTNLIYLCKSLTDPYLITSFLLDGLSIRDDEGGGGRIEIDFVDFQGPAFKDVDCRLVAFRLIQLRIANGVILEPDSDGKYKMAVPNNFLYKRPVIVERSRFKPPTLMHTEVMEAAARKLKSEGDTDKEALKIMNLQIDDLTVPTGWQETKERLERIKTIAAADTVRNGQLSREEFMNLTGDMKEEDADAIFKELSLGGDSISVDALINITNGGDSVLATDFIDRMEMLQALKYPIILSNFKRNHQLVRYLSRYTNLPIIIAVGGGGYDLQRALFNPKSYSNEEGGMLRAFGNLFESRSNRIFTYPAIDEEGNVIPCELPEGSINPLGNAWVGSEARDPAQNKAFRYGSESVMNLIESGSSEWEEFVPEGVAAICKSHAWFSRLKAGTQISPTVYTFLNNLK